MSNQETQSTYFKVEVIDSKIQVEVDGTFGDLVNLFANVFSDNEDLKQVAVMALMAVEMKDQESGDEDGALESLIQNTPMGEA
jgi:hypothetical protein